MPDLPPLDFAGFVSPHYTQVPDEVFDLLMPYLTESELKVLLYICRRTFGFKKDADAISVEQMEKGIIRKDGRRLDYGTGLARKSVQRGIAGLIDRGLIIQVRTHDAAGRDQAPIYALRWQGRQFDALSSPTADNLSNVGASIVSPQQTDESTHRNGSDRNLSNEQAALEGALRYSKQNVAAGVAAWYADGCPPWQPWLQERR
jgi:hypothetical protein